MNSIALFSTQVRSVLDEFLQQPDMLTLVAQEAKSVEAKFTGGLRERLRPDRLILGLARLLARSVGEVRPHGYGACLNM